MKVNVYLFFNGQCEEAFAQYAELFGTSPDYIQRYKDLPDHEDNPMPGDMLEKIMHMSLPLGDMCLMGSDSPPQFFEKPQGYSVSLNFTDVEQGRTMFEALAEGGQIKMPFEKTFWGPGFGACVDKFGTPWMINCNE